MTKKSFKKFLLASSCAVTTLCSSAPLTYANPFAILSSSWSVGASGTNLSNYSNQNPPTAFTTQSAIQYSSENVTINADVSTSILAIDVNGRNGAAVRVNTGSNSTSIQLELGSVYDRTATSAAGKQLALNITDGNTVKLTGTNYTGAQGSQIIPSWVSSPNISTSSSSTLIFTGAPNALYTYNSQNSQTQNGYVQTDGSGLYSNNSFGGSAPFTIEGPYNLYGLSAINLGDNTTLLIDSSIKGSPTILTNTFSFMNNANASSTNTALLLASPLTITSATVGGFGNIIPFHHQANKKGLNLTL